MSKNRNNSVPEIFDQFVSSLGLLIKEKVAEAVQAATSDFFTSKLGLNVEKEAKQTRRGKGRGRGRPKKVVAKPEVKSSRKVSRVPKISKDELEDDQPEV